MSEFYCPYCDKKTRSDLLPSMNKVWCFECQRFHPKDLKNGQKSVLIDKLVGGKDVK